MKNTNIAYLFLISFVSAMGGLLFGYDWVVIGGAKIFYEPFFNIVNSPVMRGWAMSSALIGCLLGALFSGYLSDKYGRKKMLIAASVLFTVSAWGTGAVNNFGLFIIYRIIGGLGIGIASNISPVYIAEVSPADIRGKFVSLNQLTIVTGILAAQIANWRIGAHFSMDNTELNNISREWAWRYMFWAELIPAGLFFILSFIIPESPRWLAVNGKKDKARKIFEKIANTADAESSVNTIAEKNKTKEKNPFREIFNPKMRMIMAIGIVLAVFQQWCGINIIFNYAHEIFSAAGYAVSDVLMNIVITGVCNLIFTFVAIFTVDKTGRRSLMLIGSAGLAIIYALIGAGYYLHITGIIMLILVVAAISVYAMTMAPVTWVILSEIFPNKIRGTAMSVSTFFLWAACFVLTYTFPILNNILKASGTFWIYGIICILGFLFIKRYLPETKGKSLEELEKELTK